MMIGQLSFVSIMFFLISGYGGDKKFDLKYCVPISKIDPNPERPIEDGKEMAFLLLMRSYISTDSNEAGVLSKYEFSPNGKTMTGVVNSELKWNDGSSISSEDVTKSLIKSFPFRLIGRKVRISDSKIIDHKTFKIQFQSEIENLTGVLREALSTNSRHNRFWVARTKPYPEVLAKFPTLIDSGKFYFVFGGKLILVADRDNCQNPDFSIFAESMGEGIENSLRLRSPTPSALSIQPNTQTLTLNERKNLIAWLRSVLAKVPSEHGVSGVDSFFSQGESGYDPAVKWSKNYDLRVLQKRTFRISSEIPFYGPLIAEAAKKQNIHLTLVPFPFETSEVDAQLLTSGMNQERHIILQDILEWKHTKNFIAQAPRTEKLLKEIAARSASTLPPDIATLQSFEKISMQEAALAPVARRAPVAFSKVKRPLCLGWTAVGELTFLPSDRCKEN